MLDEYNFEALFLSDDTTQRVVHIAQVYHFIFSTHGNQFTYK